VYCGRSEPNRHWEHVAAAYRRHFLPGLRLGSAYINPTVTSLLSRLAPDAAILSGTYASVTFSVATRWLSKRHIPWMYWGEQLSTTVHSPVSSIIRDILRRQLHNAALILAIGSRAADSYRFIGVPDERIRQVEYYADTSLTETVESERREASTAIRSNYRIPDSRFVCLFIGQLIRRKGVDILLEALSAADSDTVGVMVGAGPLRSELETLAEQLGVGQRVRFVGFKQPNLLQRHLLAADCLVVPSRKEGWGLVVPEGMAAGLPVVASTATNAAIDLIEDGRNGFLFPPEDSAALTEVLVKLARDPSLRARVGREARATALQHSPELGAKKLAALALEVHSGQR
jgi:glycosyltransferase involved in cell wall biosynthesis